LIISFLDIDRMQSGTMRSADQSPPPITFPALAEDNAHFESVS
jgi:hypothetical protein